MLLGSFLADDMVAVTLSFICADLVAPVRSLARPLRAPSLLSFRLETLGGRAKARTVRAQVDPDCYNLTL